MNSITATNNSEENKHLILTTFPHPIIPTILVLQMVNKVNLIQKQSLK